MTASTPADRSEHLQHLLVVSADAELARHLGQLVHRLSAAATVQLTKVADADRALDLLGNDPPDLALIDIRLPGADIPALIDHLADGGKRPLPAPIAVLCDRTAEAVAALRAGAHDCLERDAGIEQLEQAVVGARSSWRRRQHLEEERSQIAAHRRRALDELDRQEEVLRAMVAKAAVGLAQVDPTDRRLEGCNPHLARLLRTSTDALDGSPLDDWTASDHRLRLERAMEVLPTGDKDVRLPDFCCRTSRGRNTWVDLTLSPVRDGHGQVSTVVAAFQSITLHRAREQALAERNQELTDFAAASSHDLQAPLRTISIHLELLGHCLEGVLDPEQRDLLDKAVAGASRMRDMIEGVMAYLRTDERLRRREMVDLDHCLDHALANLECEISGSGTRIDRQPLPAVAGEPVLLTQCFQNLIGNALKHVPHDRGVISIAAIPEQSDGMWVIEVRDNGPGIPNELQDEIFRLFASFDSRGSGVGLACCRRAIDSLGGEIWIEPQREGEGACFRFRLPAGLGENESGPHRLG